MGRPVRVDIAVERGAYTPGSGRDNGSFHKSAPRSGNTVFIKGFNTSSGEDEIRSALEEHFGSCGEIVRISIPKDYETGAPKGSVGFSHINSLCLGSAPVLGRFPKAPC